jgi:uncharacterized protein YndB with AHSA1/START domain
MDLPVHLERTVVIRARRATVFHYFTDSARFASAWGDGSRVDALPGGEVLIRYPGNVVARGEIVELVNNERFAFTYGYDDPKKSIAPGKSRVTVTLKDTHDGTELHLRHDVATTADRDEHDPGWRFQLSLLANVIANEEHAHAAERIEGWFASWSAPDGATRGPALERAVTEDVCFRDRFACISGRTELGLHIEATRRHLAGIEIEPAGESRLCQGTALVDWVAKGPGGLALMQGTYVVELAPDGRIRSVVSVGR